MDQNKQISFNDLPIYVIFKILDNVDHIISQLNTFKKVSKKFYSNIIIYINYFNDRLEFISPNWKNNLKLTALKLVRNNKVDLLRFLLNNYEISNFVNICAGYYNNIQLVKKLKIIDYDCLFLGIIESDNIENLKFVTDNIKANNYKIITKAAEYRSLNIIKYLIQNPCFVQDLINDFNDVVKIAIKENYIDVIEILLKNNLVNPNIVVELGVRNANKKAINCAFKYGANNFDIVPENAEED